MRMVKNVCKNSNKQSKYAEMNVYVNDYCMYVRVGFSVYGAMCV